MKTLYAIIAAALVSGAAYGDPLDDLIAEVKRQDQEMLEHKRQRDEEQAQIIREQQAQVAQNKRDSDAAQKRLTATIGTRLSTWIAKPH